MVVLYWFIAASQLLFYYSFIADGLCVVCHRQNPKWLKTRVIPFKEMRKGKLSGLRMISEQTRTMFEALDGVKNTGGAGGSSTLNGLTRIDEGWRALKNGSWKIPAKSIVSVKGFASNTDTTEYDVVVCGGTLGIFYATALRKKGYSVCVVERDKVVGRPQEWNISRKELNALIRLNILTEDDIEKILSIEFNPVRVGFKSDTSAAAGNNGFELYVRDILNLGIRPDALIDIAKQRFLDAGGVIMEGALLENIEISDNSAKITYGTKTSHNDGDRQSNSIHARLVLDAMGNASPIVRQIRSGLKPDGICIVVGGCASGFDAQNNTYSDVIYTDTPLSTMGKADKYDAAYSDSNTVNGVSQQQYFWEAFPAGSGPSDRTTYLFTYMDVDPARPSIAEIYDDYWKLLPRYQGKKIEDLKFQRLLYGCFPTYRASPVQSPFDRILQVGDASGIQSPLSFGGFGSLTRHLERIIGSLGEALEEDFVSAEDLNCINAYQPNLSTCWMFQRAMSVPVKHLEGIDKLEQNVDGSTTTNMGAPVTMEYDTDPLLVIKTLSNSFSAMEKLGDTTMRPFLQDVLQFGPLLRTLLTAAVQEPLTPLRIVPHVGLTAMLDFFRHFSALGVYTLCATSPITDLTRALAESDFLSPRHRFRLRRQLEAWKFGSGLDYFDHE